jgi:hypothetical protein
MSPGTGAKAARLCFCAFHSRAGNLKRQKVHLISLGRLLVGACAVKQAATRLPEDQFKLRKIMKAIRCMRASMAVFACAGMFAGAFLFASLANAQRSAKSVAAAQAAAAEQGRNNSPYDASKEVTLQGTVVSFTENSKEFPPGAHVVVQTSSGQVDAHLGDSRLLKLNNFTISQGASIRIIGENVTTNQGTFFLARLVQQGTQVLAVRSMQGMPLLPFVRKSASNSQGGAR